MKEFFKKYYKKIIGAAILSLLFTVMVLYLITEFGIFNATVISIGTGVITAALVTGLLLVLKG